MALFRYTGRGANASPVDGVMEGESPAAVAAMLQDAGIVPVRIAPARAEGPSWKGRLGALRPGRLDSSDLALLSRQMHSLTRAGVPILRAILSVAESARTPELEQALRDVHETLRAGRTLAAALQRHGHFFPRLFVAVIQVGEESGTLEESFLQLARYYELEEETRQRVRAAVRYPVVVLGAVAVAVAVINRFVVPAFARVFEGAGVALPWPTRLLIAASDLTVAWGPHLLVGAVAAAFALRAWLATPAGRLARDRRLFAIPVLGSILERSVLARFARSFAIAHRAGVPIIQALHLSANVVDNAWVEGRLRRMAESIPRGESLSRAAATADLFTPLALQMIAVGEETGDTSRLMEELAAFYEREVEHESKRVSDLLEPLLVVLVGGVVLLLALGVYLPMWDLASAASR